MSTLDESIESFLFHCQYEKNLSSKTLEAYRIDLQQFAWFIKAGELPAAITAIDKTALRHYLEHLSQWKPKTVKRKIACLKAMFNYLEFEDRIAVNPFRKMRIRIKEPRQLPVVMEQSEVRRILKAAYMRRERISDRSSYSFAEITRDIAVLELLFATGIRVSELCGLQQHNLNLQTGLVRVLGKGNKERIIQVFDPEVRAALAGYYRLFKRSINETGYFFINRLGGQLSDQSVRFMIRNYAGRANLKKHITPHTFRHTFATLLLEADVDIKYIQHFLGHSSIMTTQIYTHVNKRKQRKILASKHPRKQFRMVGEAVEEAHRTKHKQ